MDEHSTQNVKEDSPSPSPSPSPELTDDDTTCRFCGISYLLQSAHRRMTLQLEELTMERDKLLQWGNGGREEAETKTKELQGRIMQLETELAELETKRQTEVEECRCKALEMETAARNNTSKWKVKEEEYIANQQIASDDFTRLHTMIKQTSIQQKEMPRELLALLHQHTDLYHQSTVQIHEKLKTLDQKIADEISSLNTTWKSKEQKWKADNGYLNTLVAEMETEIEKMKKVHVNDLPSLNARAKEQQILIDKLNHERQQISDAHQTRIIQLQNRFLEDLERAKLVAQETERSKNDALIQQLREEHESDIAQKAMAIDLLTAEQLTAANTINEMHRSHHEANESLGRQLKEARKECMTKDQQLANLKIIYEKCLKEHKANSEELDKLRDEMESSRKSLHDLHSESTLQRQHTIERLQRELEQSQQTSIVLEEKYKQEIASLSASILADKNSKLITQISSEHLSMTNKQIEEQLEEIDALKALVKAECEERMTLQEALKKTKPSQIIISDPTKDDIVRQHSANEPGLEDGSEIQITDVAITELNEKESAFLVQAKAAAAKKSAKIRAQNRLKV